MIDVCLVDDREDVVKGIVRSLDWEYQGFRVVNTFYDGLTAWDYIKTTPPQILITDIRMPGMDGLELLRQISESKLSVKVILISGYDDFAYAQQAISLGAEEYLLKPVPLETLMNSLILIRDVIYEEEHNKEVMSDLLLKVRDQQIILQRDFLMNLLFNKSYLEENQLKERWESLGLPDYGGVYSVLILSLIPLDPSEALDVPLLEIRQFQTAQHICSSFKTEGYSVFHFSTEPGRLVFIFQLVQSRLARQDFVTHLETQRLKLEQRLHIRISMGLGKSIRKLNKLYEACEEAKQAHDFCLFENTGVLISFSDICVSNSTVYDHSIERDLLNAVRLGNREKTHVLGEGYVKTVFDRNQNNPAACYSVIEEFLIVLKKTVLEAVGQDTWLDQSKWAIQDCRSIPDFIRLLFQACEAAISLIESNNRSVLQGIVDSSKQYIQDHYNDDISLVKAAEYAALSPPYFSNVFKSIEGVNFMDYLQHLRIHKAMELLKSDRYKVYEIANKVGYTDRKYFSSLFKKVSGYTPQEYRKINNPPSS